MRPGTPWASTNLEIISANFAGSCVGATTVNGDTVVVACPSDFPASSDDAGVGGWANAVVIGQVVRMMLIAPSPIELSLDKKRRRRGMETSLRHLGAFPSNQEGLSRSCGGSSIRTRAALNLFKPTQMAGSAGDQLNHAWL